MIRLIDFDAIDGLPYVRLEPGDEVTLRLTSTNDNRPIATLFGGLPDAADMVGAHLTRDGADVTITARFDVSGGVAVLYAGYGSAGPYWPIAVVEVHNPEPKPIVAGLA